MSDKKLIPIQDFSFDGKTIRKVFFQEIAGGDKMFVVFSDGGVMILPVYRDCPVQVGTLNDLKQDFDAMRKSIMESVTKMIVSSDTVLAIFKELEK